MAGKSALATNERIVKLLEEVRSEQAAAKRRDEELARSIGRLTRQK